MSSAASSELTPRAANNERFSFKFVFLAALIPALLGLCYGLFVIPPRMGADPAAGLLTWVHFARGGTWNTIPVPDPNDISHTIEVTINWWPPGQYLFLGILNSVGFSLGQAALILTFLSILSGGVGLAALAKELGAPTRALPWIAAAIACSQYSLGNYQAFSGGEALIMGFWPWVALTAWRLRNNSKLLICTVPALFVVGSLIKYSFAIYAICILLFLLSERVIGVAGKSGGGLLERVKEGALAGLPLLLVGILYIMGRQLLSGEGRTPVGELSSRYVYDIKTILAYSPISPLTSAATLKNSLIRHWGRDTSVLAFISPLALILYVYLATKRQPLLRFLGITAVTTVLVLSTFHILGYAISLEDRHYQQAGFLFLAATSMHAFDKRRLSWLTGILITGAIVFGVYGFSISAYANVAHREPIYMEETGLSWYFNQQVAEELISIISKSENAIIAVPYQEMALELVSFCPPSACLFFTHSLTVRPASSYKGRIPRVTIVEPASTLDSLRSRFVDYTKDEWTSHTINGWTFWQAGYPENTE